MPVLHICFWTFPVASIIKEGYSGAGTHVRIRFLRVLYWIKGPSGLLMLKTDQIKELKNIREILMILTVCLLYKIWQGVTL